MIAGLLCPYCDEPILDEEQLAPNYRQPTHYECGLRAAVGSVGHQRMRCSCYGGSEEDPEGMTRRQAATAAALYFHLGRVPASFTHPQPPEP
jgi:hypothetical protein